MNPEILIHFNGIFSPICEPSRKKTVFDMRPKERYKMMKSLHKKCSTNCKIEKGAKCHLKSSLGGNKKEFPPPTKCQGLEVYYLFAFFAFLLFFCLPKAIHIFLLPILVNNEEFEKIMSGGAEIL